MPYKTFTAGSVLTASDIMTYLMKQVIITCTSGTRPAGPSEGMTIYETDTDKIQTYSGSGWNEVAMLNPPRVRVSRNAAVNYTSGSSVSLAFDAENWDPVNMWTSGNPTRITIPSGGDGFYFMGCDMEFQATTGAQNGNRQIQVMISGSGHIRQTIPSIGSGLPTRVEISYGAQLDAGDYIEFQGRQDSGVTLTVTGTAWACRIAPKV
jgi:hypothetical protein